MNKIYRLIWNAARGMWQVAAEIGASRGKSQSQTRAARSGVVGARSRAGAAMGAGALLLVHSSLVFATLPTDGSVTAGSGSISQSGGHMTIDQSTHKMAIDWQGFSIGRDNSVTFSQPSSSAMALNRVLGSDVSVIQGAINANGQVFLVNPNGVLFTPTAQVNVGGMVASTLSISNEDFLAGNYRFEGTSGNAIINQGNIQAIGDGTGGGYIAMIAARIENTGSLTARQGDVLMGAGSKVTLDLGGPVKIEVEAGAIDALIEQGGAIKADGGLVYLTAKAAGALVTTVINHTGVTEAQTLATGESGQIYLMGDADLGNISVAGTIDASAPNGGSGGTVWVSGSEVALTGLVDVASGGAKGGRILLEGDHITLTGDSRLDATGATGGGAVLVGGDWQGGANEERRVFDDPNALQQATTVTMEAGATIDASATQNGDGGTVVLWSDITNPDSLTTVRGTIRAGGGAEGGDGGQIETSGYEVDTAGASISASAPKGTGGLWLIDPTDVSITQAVADGYASTLNGGTSVVNQVTGTITMQDNVVISKTAGGDATLTFKATQNLLLGGSSRIQSTSGKLNVVFWSDSNGNGDGGIRLDFGNVITTNGGHIYMGGGSGSKSWNGLTSVPSGDSRANGSLWGEAINIISGTLNAGGGHIELLGLTTSPTNAFGIRLDNSAVFTSGAGTITLLGDATGSLSASAWGVLVRNNSVVQSASGAISITGYGGSDNKYGVVLEGGNPRIESASGAITLQGTRGGLSLPKVPGIYLGDNARVGKGALGSSTSNISLIANDLVFFGTPQVQSTGTLTISAPNLGTTNIAIASADTASSLNIKPSYFGTQFVNGFSGINLGSTAAGGTLTVFNDLSVSAPLALRGNNVVVNANLTTSNNNLTVDFSSDSGTLGASSTINLGSGGLIMQGGGTFTVASSLSYTGTTTINNASTLQVGSGGSTGQLGSGPVVLNNGTLAFNRSNDLTVANNISGIGTLRKEGAGTLTLTSNNSYGQTRINGGTLQVGNGGTTGQLGSGLVIMANNASLVFNRSNALTVANDISGTGSLTQQGGGTLTLSGNSSYSGLTNINNASKLIATTNNALGAASTTWIGTGSTLELAGITTAEGIGLYGTLASTGVSSVTGDVFMLSNSAGTINVPTGSQLTLSGNLGNDGGTSLTKTGGGTAVFSGNNQFFSLPIFVDAGTLRVTHANGLGTTAGGTTVGLNGTLDLRAVAIGAQPITLNGGTLANSSGTSSLSGAVTLGNNSTFNVGGTELTLSGVISGAHNITKTGGGILTLGGVNEYTGSTTISAGTLRLNSAGTIANSSIVVNYSNFIILDNKTIAAMTGYGTTALGANTLTVGNNTDWEYSGGISGTGGITKVGAGAWTLSGVNSYFGATNINAGTLRVRNAAGLGATSGNTIVASNGTLDLRDVTIGAQPITLNGGTLANGFGTSSLSGAITLGEPNSFINVGGTQLTLSGVISGANRGITKTGTGILTLGGVNTYTGVTTINAGWLELNNNGRIEASSNVVNNSNFRILGNQTIASITGSGSTALGANTLTIGNASNTSSLYSGIISGTGGLTKAGTGTLTLGGVNTYSGATTIDSGTLTLNGTGTIANSSGVANNSAFSIGGNKIIAAMTGSGTTALGGNTLTVGDNRNFWSLYSGSISGTGGLTKAGTGTLTLDGVNTYTGATTINAGTLLIRNDDPLSANDTSTYSGSGALTIEPTSASFTSAFDLTSIPITDTLGGLTIGKAGNAAHITAGATTVAGPIEIYGGDITLNGALIATGTNTITLQGSGNVTNNGAGGYVSADKLALTGSGNVTLDSISNAIGTLAASDVASLRYVNSNALTISTVNPTGISATGPVLIETLSGDLFITENIATSDTSDNAVVLNAGKNSAAGDAAGGNIIVTSGKTVTVGDGGRATLFTGSITGSSGLTALVGSGSGRFRYNSDEADTNYTAQLGTGLYAIYREQPDPSGAISAPSITYGDINPIFTLSGGGLQNGDGLSGLTISGATYSTSSILNVGSYTVDASGLVTDLTALGYNATGITDGTLTVGRKDLNVSYSGVDRAYDGTTDAIVNSSDDRISGDMLTITETAAFITKDADIGKTVNVTETSLSGTDAGNYTLIAQASTVATIDKASATVIANSETVTYSGLVQVVSGFTADGLVNGETIEVLSGVTTSGGSGTNAGNYLHSASGADNNYTLSFINGSLTIDKANATVTANSDTVTYNGLEHSVTGFTAIGLVNGETIAVLGGVTTSGASGINAGTYVHTASGTDDNYDLSFINGSLTIDKANATVTANSDTVTYDGLAHSVTGFTASGLVNDETIAVLGSVTTSGGSGINAGTYVHTASGTDENYDLTFNDGTLTIDPRPISVKADDLNKIYGNVDPNLTWQVTDGSLVNGDSLGALTRAAGENVGNYTINGSALANGNYLITAVNGTLTITQRPITVTADGKGKQAGENDPALTFQTEAQSSDRGLVTGDIISGNLIRETGEGTGSYAIEQGTVTNTSNPNYDINYVGNNLTIAAVIVAPPPPPAPEPEPAPEPPPPAPEPEPAPEPPPPAPEPEPAPEPPPPAPEPEPAPASTEPFDQPIADAQQLLFGRESPSGFSQLANPAPLFSSVNGQTSGGQSAFMVGGVTYVTVGKSVGDSGDAGEDAPDSESQSDEGGVDASGFVRVFVVNGGINLPAVAFDAVEDSGDIR